MRRTFRLFLPIFLLAPIFSAPAAPIPGAPVVTNLFAGCLQSFLLFSDGSLWAAGLNSEGQLGDGSYQSPSYRFEQIRSNDVAFVTTGSTHTLLIHSDGSLDATGDDTDGDLGDGGSFRVNKFQGVPANPTGVISAAVGLNHSMFVKENGALMGMGVNNVAQLGDGNQNNTNKPVQIVASGVASVACSSSGSFFIKTDGSLWGTGSLNSFRYDSNDRPGPILRGGAAALACGAGFVLVISTNGALLAFGANSFGQLGDGTTNASTLPKQIVSNGVVAIACGNNFAHFIKSDGSLWAMGFNQDGQLGDGSTNNCSAPELIVSNSVVAVAAGIAHTLFLKSDGSVWACGFDGQSNFGDNFTNNIVPTPQQIYPLPPSALSLTAPAPSRLQISASCPRGGLSYLLSSPDLSQPLNQWTPVATNTTFDRFNNLFSITLTNALPEQFYILQSP